LGEGRCSTEPVRSPLATFLLPTRPIAPISPEVVAINRLDKPQRIDRPPTDHGANAVDHREGARPKKCVIGGIKGAIGWQLIGKEAQISGKTTLSKR
jgi:hypothetical protein